ncbi:MAG: aldehyde-activating protein [Rhodobacterales bacterium CG2_30_65_12]|nr:MAG: aldehyde-activating protein [Rhodobacterales bacterium CG2_30_65_12]
MLTGSCLCGDITFKVFGTPRDPAACHCSMCRKTSGHIWAAAIVDEGEIEITGPVRWYRSSDVAERGFCPRCGASLFWREIGTGHMDFALGAVDGPTGLRLARHIFTEDKGDYYDICSHEHPQEGE